VIQGQWGGEEQVPRNPTETDLSAMFFPKKDGSPWQKDKERHAGKMGIKGRKMTQCLSQLQRGRKENWTRKRQRRKKKEEYLLLLIWGEQEMNGSG